ncbi:MAG: polysaccharide deacetylase family protein [Bacteroidia bacterium]|nr:polysaccharide deacetylase family protein [Bacteroidia bacterium]
MRHLWRLPRWIHLISGAYLPPQRADRIFYLTFDDGPAGSTTCYLLDLLEEYSYTATFFWLWSRYEEKSTPKQLQRIQERGHFIAIHGLTHLSPWRNAFVSSQCPIEQAYLLWSKTGAPILPLYRPPYGHIPFYSRHRIPLVLWDLMPPDYLPGVRWTESLLERLRPGDIVVLHEKAWSRKEWERFFSAAAGSGWKGVALSQEEQG